MPTVSAGHDEPAETVELQRGTRLGQCAEMKPELVACTLWRRDARCPQVVDHCSRACGECDRSAKCPRRIESPAQGRRNAWSLLPHAGEQRRMRGRPSRCSRSVQGPQDALLRRLLEVRETRAADVGDAHDRHASRFLGHGKHRRHLANTRLRAVMELRRIPLPIGKGGRDLPQRQPPRLLSERKNAANVLRLPIVGSASAPSHSSADGARPENCRSPRKGKGPEQAPAMSRSWPASRARTPAAGTRGRREMDERAAPTNAR